MKHAPKKSPPVKRFKSISFTAPIQFLEEIKPLTNEQTATVETKVNGARQSIVFVTRRKTKEMRINKIEISPVQPLLKQKKYSKKV